ncbi:uncharacterized protein GGS25DRAFT_517280 [Hypoxylon fragiforme]|uniref:uncharacterized protein n=1 Tax=Hypoxylon fragiforme TaxID=63214 RepID=UPI0020C60AAB|nr:uncharacterized protein GGS25DRAFT_517280 [Hypoxylon fragiforme]KAI2614432.1 hypothetical protein GGS25DRAFT_517280 [Hypoxylon fragiforme]
MGKVCLLPLVLLLLSLSLAVGALPLAWRASDMRSKRKGHRVREKKLERSPFLPVLEQQVNPDWATFERGELEKQGWGIA